MTPPATTLVCGAAGFIGRHLFSRLVADGFDVIGVDYTPSSVVSHSSGFIRYCDLRRYEEVDDLFETFSPNDVYQLASDMGGRGYIDSMPADAFIGNAAINLNVLRAARTHKAAHLLLASSACVYPESAGTELHESMAYPASPDGDYGWEKLNAERLYRSVAAAAKPVTSIPRLDNTYGPGNVWDGGREKVPAAVCRKVALAKLNGSPTIEMWGSPDVRRVFSYIDDTVEGLVRLMRSAYPHPINIGGGDYCSIKELVEIVAEAADYPVRVEWQSDKGGGSTDRRTSNELCEEVLGWKPTIRLREGMAKTYPWVEQQVRHRYQKRWKS